MWKWGDTCLGNGDAAGPEMGPREIPGKFVLGPIEIRPGKFVGVNNCRKTHIKLVPGNSREAEMGEELGPREIPGKFPGKSRCDFGEPRGPHLGQLGRPGPPKMQPKCHPEYYTKKCNSQCGGLSHPTVTKHCLNSALHLPQMSFQQPSDVHPYRF